MMHTHTKESPFCGWVCFGRHVSGAAGGGGGRHPADELDDDDEWALEHARADVEHARADEVDDDEGAYRRWLS